MEDTTKPPPLSRQRESATSSRYSQSAPIPMARRRASSYLVTSKTQEQVKGEAVPTPAKSEPHDISADHKPAKFSVRQRKKYFESLITECVPHSEEKIGTIPSNTKPHPELKRAVSLSHGQNHVHQSPAVPSPKPRRRTNTVSETPKQDKVPYLPRNKEGKSSSTSFRLQPLLPLNGAATLPRVLKSVHQRSAPSPTTRGRTSIASEATKEDERFSESKTSDYSKKVECDHSTSLSMLNKTFEGKQQLVADLNSANQEIKQLKDQLVFANQEFDDLLQQIKSYKEELETQRQLVESQTELTQNIERKAEDQIWSIRTQIFQVEKEMEHYKDSLVRVEGNFQGAQQELRRCQQELRHSQQCIQTQEARIVELKENAHRSRVEIEDLKIKLERSSELSPYLCIPELPIMGDIKGIGSYGSVYHIQLNGVDCIAKRLHNILLGQGLEEQVSLEDKCVAHRKFQNECILLSRIRHPNIVKFIGVHYGPQRDYGKELTLVMEYLHINLEECLTKYPNIEMWLKISFLLDVSQGLLHLHSLGVIHRDLTAPNILLTTSYQAKIADLGVSKIIDVHPLTATKQSMIPGTLGYMPPEALSETPAYSFALDIFSFGVVMLFVLNQQYPQYYENTVTSHGVSRKEIQIEKRMKWIRKLPPRDPMRLFICRCLKDEPDRRPSTNEVNSTLINFSKSHPKQQYYN